MNTAEAEKSQKVLIIDDDPFILDMYALKFRADGFQVEVAHDGKAGLEKIKAIAPAIVLVDVVMPVMDGFELLEALKGVTPRPKIILLTNLGQKENIERGMALGADDYIIKAHFTPSEVVKKTKEILKK